MKINTAKLEQLFLLFEVEQEFGSATIQVLNQHLTLDVSKFELLNNVRL